MNKFCQSCGMPMKNDPEHGGTNADGSRTHRGQTFKSQYLLDDQGNYAKMRAWQGSCGFSMRGRSTT
jgi:hypothetical protein